MINGNVFYVFNLCICLLYPYLMAVAISCEISSCHHGPWAEVHCLKYPVV